MEKPLDKGIYVFYNEYRLRIILILKIEIEMKKNELLIKKVLDESGGHLTAEEVFFECKKRGENISLATVYNNLNALCEEKLIRKIPSACDGKDRYDKAYMPHGHLICEKCHKVSDFFSDEIGKTILSVTGISPDSYDLNVYYVCPDCATNSIPTEYNK